MLYHHSKYVVNTWCWKLMLLPSDVLNSLKNRKASQFFFKEQQNNDNFILEYHIHMSKYLSINIGFHGFVL